MVPVDFLNGLPGKAGDSCLGTTRYPGVANSPQCGETRPDWGLLYIAKTVFASRVRAQEGGGAFISGGVMGADRAGCHPLLPAMKKVSEEKMPRKSAAESQSLQSSGLFHDLPRQII